MKKFGIGFISIFILSIIIFILAMIWKDDNDKSEGPVDLSSLTQQKIRNIFLINGKLYCIDYEGKLYIRRKESDKLKAYRMAGGTLYLRKNDSDKLIHTFPTDNVQWSDKLKAFLYYKDRTIFSYDPFKKSTIALFEMNLEYKDSYNDYIFEVIDHYVFLSLDFKKYKFNLETSEVFPLSEFVFGKRAKNSDMIVYTTHLDNNVMCLELATNKEYKLSNKNFYNGLSIDIVSLCIVDDNIYFIKSDGQIYGVQINNGEAKSIEVFPKDADIFKKHIIAIEWTGDNFICVILDYNKDNGTKSLSVCEVALDGTYTVIRNEDKIFYDTEVYSCILKIEGQLFAYLVQTDDLVVSGKLKSKK